MGDYVSPRDAARVAIILENQDRFFGCSQSEILLRRCLLDSLTQTRMDLSEAWCLDNTGKMLLGLMVCEEPIQSTLTEWHAFLAALRAGGIRPIAPFSSLEEDAWSVPTPMASR